MDRIFYWLITLVGYGLFMCGLIPLMGDSYSGGKPFCFWWIQNGYEPTYFYFYMIGLMIFGFIIVFVIAPFFSDDKPKNKRRG